MKSDLKPVQMSPQRSWNLVKRSLFLFIFIPFICWFNCLWSKQLKCRPSFHPNMPLSADRVSKRGHGHGNSLKFPCHGSSPVLPKVFWARPKLACWNIFATQWFNIFHVKLFLIGHKKDCLLNFLHLEDTKLRVWAQFPLPRPMRMISWKTIYRGSGDPFVRHLRPTFGSRPIVWEALSYPCIHHDPHGETVLV